MEIISGDGAGGGERLSSQNLRDLLRIKDEYHHHNLNQSTSSNGGGGGNNPSGLTLEAVLRDKRGPPPPEDADEPLQRVQSNRTLLDIIREDQTSGFGGRGRSRRSWRHLKDKIRLPRRGGGAAAYSSSIRIPASDVPLNNHQHHRASARFNSNTNSSETTQHDISGDLDTSSSRFEPTSSLPRSQLISEDNHRIIVEEIEEHGGEDTLEAAEQPVRMSLMALLAENDRQMGLEGSAYAMDEDQEGEEDEDTITTGGGAALNGGEYNNCCVCMVRHKGAAFIPCGHTFCRLCSRELWVKRGNCPLCNNYILEILDIF